jgi:hypothetical protein
VTMGLSRQAKGHGLKWIQSAIVFLLLRTVASDSGLQLTYCSDQNTGTQNPTGKKLDHSIRTMLTTIDFKTLRYISLWETAKHYAKHSMPSLSSKAITAGVLIMLLEISQL